MNFLESIEVSKFIHEVAHHPRELIALFSLPMFAMAFSLASKRAMKQRSIETHGYLADELTGEHCEHGEAAHIDHTHNEQYDDPDNGVYVATKTHLWMHLEDEDNGLTQQQNVYAIRELKKRLHGNP